MKNILITGGAGFVGAYLAEQFHKNGQSVTIFDNLKRRGSEFNMQRLAEMGIRFIHGDIRNMEDLQFDFPIDLLIECSAEPSVLAGFGDNPLYVINTNLTGAINCIEIARKKDAAIVFLSTSRVYPVKSLQNIRYTEAQTRFEISEEQPMPGVSPKGISENFPLHGSRTLYGATKLAAEEILQEYIDAYGLRAIINRCGVLAGPGQMGKIDQGVITFWIANHIYNKPLQYIGFGGTGKQVRDMLHVEDLYQLLKIQLQDIDTHSGVVYNAGGGRTGSLSLQELTDLCQKVTGNKVPIKQVTDNRQGDIPVYITDNTKVTAETGWEPQRGPQQLVQDIAEWIQSNKKELEKIFN